MKIGYLKSLVLFSMIFVMLENVQGQIQTSNNYYSSIIKTDQNNPIANFPADGERSIILSESFDETAFPPSGWQNVQISGTGLWARSTSGTNPTCTPYSGTAMAYFNSYTYSSGTTAALITQVLPFTAGLNKVIDFWMYRDPGFSSNIDSIGVYYNTTANLTNARFLGNISRYNSTAGWFNFCFYIPPTVSGNYYLIFKATSRYGNNMFIDDLTVYTTFANDVGLTAITNPPAGILPGSVIPQVNVKNFGTITQTNFPVKYKIGVNGTTIVETIPNLEPGESFLVNFPEWNASLGEYDFIFYADMMGDAVRTNDTLKRKVRVVNKFNKAYCLKYGTQPASFTVENPTIGLANFGSPLPWVSRGGAYVATGIDSYKWYVIANDKSLYSIDTVTGSPLLIGNTGVADNFLSGLTYDKTSNILYASGLSGTYPNFSFNLYVVNVNNGVASLIATSSSTGCFFELACNNYGQMFVIEYRPGSTGRLHSVNKTTAALTPIGNNLGGNMSSNFQDIDFTDDNILYFTAAIGTDGNMDGLYTINTNTGLATLMSVFPTANTQIVGLGIKQAFGSGIVENNPSLNNITIFPNPASDLISIISDDKEKIEKLEVLDISGKIIYTEFPEHFATTLNTTVYKAGYYIIQLKTSNGAYTEKIVITK